MTHLAILPAARKRIPTPPSTGLRALLLIPISRTRPPTTGSHSFTTSAPLHKRRQIPGEKRDSRIKLIRYHLFHPLNPRPLRLSRSRYLRHWTIHRAWQLFKANQRREEQLALQRQYQSMREACEALRLLGEDGLAVQDAPAGEGRHGPGPSSRTVRPPGARDPVARTFLRRADGGLIAADMVGEKGVEVKEGERVEVDVASAAERQSEVGRLYRLAMEKKGVFQGVPIEYARIQTDTPPKAGWDHAWKR